MATSSILGGERAAIPPDGKDVDALGPSDSSDSGSDVQAAPPPGVADSNGPVLPSERGADSDASGTGERGSVVAGDEALVGADIDTDRVVATPDGSVPRGAGEGEDVERIAQDLTDPLADDPLADDPPPG